MKHSELLAEIRELDRKQREFGNMPETGRRISDGGTIDLTNPFNEQRFVLLHGVSVEESLWYEAQGIPLGSPPADRPEAVDHFRGIPEAVLGRCFRCAVSWKWGP